VGRIPGDESLVMGDFVLLLHPRPIVVEELDPRFGIRALRCLGVFMDGKAPR
jgi:hypothetical protein